MSFRRTALARTGGKRPILISDPAGNPTPNLEILKHGLAPEITLEIGKPYNHPHATSSDTPQERPQWPAPDAAEHERSSGTPGTHSHTRQRLASAA
jgi:hypothetical protein